MSPMIPGTSIESLPIDNEQGLLGEIQRHIVYTLGHDFAPPKRHLYFQGMAYSLRSRLLARWLETQRRFYASEAKRIYYLSLEFLPGRFLMNYLLNLKTEEKYRNALEKIGFDLEEIEEEEWDAGLGNGGLGRLASCFMDSMATMKIPAYGYGILYDYGIFFQTIIDGWQVEQSDNWRRFGNPWEIKRPSFLYEIKFYGRSEAYTDSGGMRRYRWVDTDNIMAMACDILIPGYANDNVINMRLWAAVSSREFNLAEFNQGDYIGAIHAKVMSESISKVLYPNDEAAAGRELRLKQQYFFVAATFKDILRRFKKHRLPFKEFPNRIAVQLNDTHPAIAIPELMRILLDEEGLEWDQAWEICQATFAYTNHTVLPEALETWPIELIGRVLPRHLEIIYEINHQFLQAVRRKHPGNDDLLARMSLIQEFPERRVRMANLAVVGSHSVNGVAALHTRILKKGLFKDFDGFFPGRIINITNGITPRRWLLQTNPALSRLISQTIGSGWVCDLEALQGLARHAEDRQFRDQWRAVKRKNKKRLARYILRKMGVGVDPDTLFDVQVKRIHEYKRQLLNVLHVITLYNRLLENPDSLGAARTVIIGGKAAPSYRQAKLIIKLIHAVADTINRDPRVRDRLKLIFLPNYCISQAEKVIPAADISEQISTAGMEASGTGNMKFALNGAPVVGTLDGANIEIMEAVGSENIFTFGLTAEQIDRLRTGGHNPLDYFLKDPELKTALDMIGSGHFSRRQPDLFSPILDSLMQKGDYYCVMADYRAFIQVQEKVSAAFADAEDWTRRSILNTAHMGRFSSDRAIAEYVRKIWKVKPLTA